MIFIEYRCGSVVGITVWAQEHLWKLLSLNTVSIQVKKSMNCFLSERSESDVLFGNRGRPTLQAEEERPHRTCCECKDWAHCL